MPSHDPSRARKPRRSRRKDCSVHPNSSDAETSPSRPCVDPVGESFSLELQEWRLVGNVEDWAPVLMSSNYADHLALEDAAAAPQRSAVAEFFQPSTYRARLHGEQLEQYDGRTADRQRDSVAHLRRAVNQRSSQYLRALFRG